jgi:hypothetical protein
VVRWVDTCPRDDLRLYLDAKRDRMTQTTRWICRALALDGLLGLQHTIVYSNEEDSGLIMA